MDRVAGMAGAGFATTTGGWLVQSKQRVALLDIDIFQGLLSFDVPIGNVIILIGVGLSAYAAWVSRQHRKEQRRREGDRKFPDSIVKKPKK